MSLNRILLGIALAIIGLLGIMVGGADDAPGAGLIGFILIVLGLYLIITSRKSSKIYKARRK